MAHPEVTWTNDPQESGEDTSDDDAALLAQALALSVEADPAGEAINGAPPPSPIPPTPLAIASAKAAAPPPFGDSYAERCAALAHRPFEQQQQQSCDSAGTTGMAAQLREITGADEATARWYLEQSGGDINTAVTLFFDRSSAWGVAATVAEPAVRDVSLGSRSCSAIPSVAAATVAAGSGGAGATREATRRRHDVE